MMNPRRFNKEQNYFHCSAGFTSDLWIQLPKIERWKILNQGLFKMAKRSDFQVHSFVMMETHLHLLFSSVQLMEHTLMEEFHGNILKILQQQGHNVQILFEEPLYCERIQNLNQYKSTYRYIYLNPVEAFIVARCEDYLFSSLREIIYGVSIQESVNWCDQMNLIQNPFGVLQWLNSAMEIPLKPFKTAMDLNETRRLSFLNDLDPAPRDLLDLK